MKLRSFGLTAAAVVTFSILVSARQSLPTPASSIGFDLGADYKLATYTQAVEYLKKLDAASASMRLFEAGKSSQGREYVYAAISSPENLADIEKYRQISLRLAHPDALTDAQAKSLAAEGKAIVHIDGGLHATEVAGPQSMTLLAYNLLNSANDPKTKRILDNVIFLLWPTINPDGQEQVASHYMKTQGPDGRGGQSFPALYQDYVGHDNNRDAYMMNMQESRVMEHAWRQWEPQIIYVHHQTSPFPSRIWLPPFADPIGLEAPPMISRQLNMIGMAIARELEEKGMPGSTHMGNFDAWYPGYIDYMPVFKNIAAFWTETAGAGLANPRTYTINDIPQNMRDFRPDALYTSPWKPGLWRLKDSVDYMATASIATLDFAARYKDEVLYDRYIAGRDQIARGKKEAPYAYVFPLRQRDSVLAVELLRRLAFGGVRVYQLTETALIDGANYAAGTWVIPTDQEFAAIAREVLDVQKYPDLRDFAGGPPEQPYDASGWTLPMSMDVAIVYAKTPLAAGTRAAMKLLGTPAASTGPTPYTSATELAAFDSVPGAGFNTESNAAAIVPPDGAIVGRGPALSINAAQVNTMRALQSAWKAGATVRFVPGNDLALHPSVPMYQIVGMSDLAAAAMVKALALQVARTPVAGTIVKQPRVAIYNPPNSMDAGWTRWVLEQYGIPFTPLAPGEAFADLRNKFDVIVVTSEGGTPFGGAPGRGGRAGGAPGGAGAAGAAGAGSAGAPPVDPAKPFDEFVRAGGTLLCFNAASMAAVNALKLPVTNAAALLPRTEFFLNGSLLEVTTHKTHQVMAGMPDKAAIFTDGSPVFQTQDGFKGTVLARYADTGSPLKSGYLLGEKVLNGKAAALDVEHGDGHVILLGFRPQWRGQTFSTFRVIFNSLLLTR